MARPAEPSSLDQPQRDTLPQVFVSFKGEELSNNFFSHLVVTLKDGGVNVLIDTHDMGGEDIKSLLRKIEKSKVALVIFSENFAESEWCLHEVLKINERVSKGSLVAIPVFYKVSPKDVRLLQGKFGECFAKTVKRQGSKDHSLRSQYVDSVRSIASMLGLTSEAHSSDYDFVTEIVKAVKRQVAPYPSSSN